MLCLLIAATASLAIEARSRSRAKKNFKDVGDSDNHRVETSSGKSAKKSLKSSWKRISEPRRMSFSSNNSGSCRSSHRRSGCGGCCSSSSRARQHPNPFSNSRSSTRGDNNSDSNNNNDTLPKYERESKDITITDTQMLQRSNSTSSNNTITSNEINLQNSENDIPPPYTKF
ncbi:hypothetical protein B5S31_g3601 [[Candida] boidinii]|uniref:Unnamed protein product n=1 Tax=Candida boidinii TaxID=5477 RepID=A0ACB5TVQ1_CANBO|nr:hypothetical protein B5S31_g3601 [[Candida] boidinii]OWB79973.1 hypothetical protein B5S32_g4216 [[Candida] boidinii]GME96178.1 unnamed protein product [[Candida] boidinii]